MKRPSNIAKDIKVKCSKDVRHRYQLELTNASIGQMLFVKPINKCARLFIRVCEKDFSKPTKYRISLSAEEWFMLDLYAPYISQALADVAANTVDITWTLSSKVAISVKSDYGCQVDIRKIVSRVNKNGELRKGTERGVRLCLEAWEKILKHSSEVIKPTAFIHIFNILCSVSGV